MPDLSKGAAGDFNRMAGNAKRQYDEEKAAAEGGATALEAGVSVFRERNSSAMSAAKNAVSPSGLKFDSGAGYAAKLNERAENDPALRATLDKINNNGGRMTQNERDYIQLKLR